MNPLSVRLLTLTAALAVLGTGQARAGQIHYSWAFQPDPPIVNGDDGPNPGTVSFAVNPGGTFLSPPRGPPASRSRGSTSPAPSGPARPATSTPPSI